MISAALTSVLTGITEPIEFSFMFVAPLLYAMHAVLTGVAFGLMNFLGAHIGYTFSQGGIDFLLYYAIDTKPWLVFIVGPIYAVVYYFLFRAVIRWFDYKTPGREDDDNGVAVSASAEDDRFGFAKKSSSPLAASPTSLTSTPALPVYGSRSRIAPRSMRRS